MPNQIDGVDQRNPLTMHYAESADGYEQFWAPVVAPITLRLLPRLLLEDASLVLDLGAGTGHLLSALRSAAPQASLVGVDLTLGMLQQAVLPLRSAVAVMDARQLAMSTDVVDVVVSPFMLFHVEEPIEALTEVLRVLRPGGSFGMTTWGTLRIPSVQQEAVELLDQAGAPLDPPTDGDSYHLQDDPHKVRALLAEAGFARTESWTESLDHHWEPERLFSHLISRGSFSRRLAMLDEGVRVDVIERVRNLIGDSTPEDRYNASEAVVAMAKKPA